jgi:hypothetical protein
VNPVEGCGRAVLALIVVVVVVVVVLSWILEFILNVSEYWLLWLIIVPVWFLGFGVTMGLSLKVRPPDEANESSDRWTAIRSTLVLWPILLAMFVAELLAATWRYIVEAVRARNMG